jgi:hypothetical protein
LTALKKQQIAKVQSQDGEIHLILDELGYDENLNCKYVEKDEAKKIMKKEARKPLYLRR